MNAASVLIALKEQLEADVNLKAFIKKVFLGVREDITQFPCIILEPVSLEEGSEVYTKQELILRVSVLTYMRIENAEKQIVGDQFTKGMLDIENDVKAAVSAYPTLSGACHYFEIKNTNYDFVNYPVRSFSMELEIYFRQDVISRI